MIFKRKCPIHYWLRIFCVAYWIYWLALVTVLVTI